MSLDPQLERAMAINSYQANPYVHPMTCGKDSNHRPLVAHAEWTAAQTYKVTLHCLDCDYVQIHIPPFITPKWREHEHHSPAK